MRILLLDPLDDDALWISKHEVTTCGTGALKTDIPLTGKVRRLRQVIDGLDPKPDIILQREWGGNSIYTDLHMIEIPRVFFSKDPHMTDSWVGDYASIFDAVITTQLDYKQYFKNHGVPSVYWSPWYSTLTLAESNEKHPECERKIDVSFVGNMDKPFHNKRRKFFELLKSELGKTDITYHIGIGDWKLIYKDSKIVVNEAQALDVNKRLFEATSCGALVLTPRLQNGFDRFFKDDINTVIYNDGDALNCMSRIRGLLNDADKRIRIAKKGWELTKMRDLFLEHRIPWLIETLRDVSKTKPRTATEKMRQSVASALLKLAARPLPPNATEAEKKEMVSDRLDEAARVLHEN